MGTIFRLDQVYKLMSSILIVTSNYAYMLMYQCDVLIKIILPFAVFHCIAVICYRTEFILVHAVKLKITFHLFAYTVHVWTQVYRSI